MQSPYKLAINMAGAVSAGAYTAGVLDFLIEALDAWQAAKAAGENVPQHSVSIEILTGASAGGMCSALGAVSLFDQPNPCPGPNAAWTSPTRMYRAWVDEIDISDLVSTTDLDAPALYSLLNSDTLDSIAAKTLGPPSPLHKRDYVSPQLNLLLTLTNLRGIPYSVDAANGGSFEEHVSYFADQMQFQLSTGAVNPAVSPTTDWVLNLNGGETAGWEALRLAAIASGAVPGMLKPRVLARTAETYEQRKWTISLQAAKPAPGGGCVCDTTTPIPPAWEKPAAPFNNVYVDGGVTNNSPFECARRYLAALSGVEHNERDPLKAAASVLTIAPFPGEDSFSLNWDVAGNSTLFGSLAALVDVLVGQSRFLGESLSLLKDQGAASRYMIVPRDEKVQAGQPALQSGALGAFGGFFHDGFRKHDYHLGRYNCQRFLSHWFVLPCENALIDAGLPPEKRAALIAAFKAVDLPGDPPRTGPETQAWMPIIPLCGALSQPLPYPVPQTITSAQLATILDSVFNRVGAVVTRILKPHLPLSWLTTGAVVRAIVKSVRARSEPGITTNLKSSRCLS